MRKMLNTLYVMTPESYLTKDGEDIVISVKQQETFRIPILFSYFAPPKTDFMVS